MSRTPQDTCYDAVVIGSGAGGGPVAFVLARAGFEVLVIEKGRRWERHDFIHDELERLPDGASFMPSLEDDPHILVRPGQAPERSQLGWIGSCVGGGTVRAGGYFYRFHPDDLRLVSRCGAHEELADWPIDYRTLEPYYSMAEWQVGVSGSASPYDRGRRRGLPMPAVDCHPLSRVLEGACRRLGVQAFETPRGVSSRPYGQRPACSYCDFCGEYGCPTGAKGSVPEAFLGRAEATGRCEVRAETMVREILYDATTERVSGCVAVDRHGEEREIRAKVVCVAASAVESARLLLLSASPRFPDGLGNDHGLVGRHLQFHAGSTARARFRPHRPLPEAALFDRNPYLGRSVADDYFLPPGISDLPKGGILRFGMTSPEPINAALRLAAPGGTALWGDDLERALEDYFLDSREVHFEVFQDFLPNAGTRVELDPEVRDRWGLPVARIHLQEPEHHRLAGQYLVDRGLEILEAMGGDSPTVGGVGVTTRVHAHGTCRFGRDPQLSVLDAHCRVHGIANLYVTDGSFMPTSGGAAPTLTILANSLRVGHWLASQL